MFLNNPLDNDQFQVFTTTQSTSATSWISWNLPFCNFIHFYVVGGGGGGGGGHTAASGTQRGGGGGGGSGAFTSIIFPRLILPDTVYMLVGNGGAGGAATVAGSSGVSSFVSTKPDFTGSTPMDYIAFATNGGGGGAGTGAAGGASGSAGTAPADTSARYHNLGFTVFRSGQTGNAGSSNGAPGGLNQGAGLPFTGGGGGAGIATTTNVAGGAIIPSTSLQGCQNLAGGTTSVPDGNSGYIWRPSGSNNALWASGVATMIPGFLMFGGSGGASQNAATGGRGGHGTIGAGGGGGGGGQTGGAGGNGGDGIIVVSWW